MNKKTITSVLCKKHDDFVNSIDDEEVKKLVDKNSIITGGAIVSMLLNEKVNDYDYYFTNRDTVFAVAKYYVNKFKKTHENNSDKVKLHVLEEENGRVKVFVKSEGIVEVSPNEIFESQPQDEIVDIVEDLDDIPAESVDTKIINPEDIVDKTQNLTPFKYRPVFMTSNAITLSNKVQLVMRFYGEASEIHKNYDFVHCTNYWTSSDRKLHLQQPALESILAKQLYYTGSLYPMASVMRTRKFIKRGWHINAGQYIKMCFQISELDLTDINVLEDQLTGVDNAYFYQVIEWFKKKKLEDENFEIKLPYLISIIDKIF